MNHSVIILGVARSRAPGRLQDVLDAARSVFLTVGYRRARMSDVATAAGVSPGLLYTYAAGKEALFSLVIQRELGVDVDALPLPIAAPEPGAVEALVAGTMRDLGQGPILSTEMPPADVRTEIETLIGQAYDAIYRYRYFLKLVEKSALDWPSLSAGYYEDGRQPLLDRVAAYIAVRVDNGDFKPVPDAFVAARFVIESVSWFANHRFGDHDGAQIDDAVARETVVTMVSRALIGSS